jgi:hypothetical protein
MNPKFWERGDVEGSDVIFVGKYNLRGKVGAGSSDDKLKSDVVDGRRRVNRQISFMTRNNPFLLLLWLHLAACFIQLNNQTRWIDVRLHERV